MRVQNILYMCLLKNGLEIEFSYIKSVEPKKPRHPNVVLIEAHFNTIIHQTSSQQARTNVDVEVHLDANRISKTEQVCVIFSWTW